MIDFDKEKSICSAGHKLLEHFFEDFLEKEFEKEVLDLRICHFMSKTNWFPTTIRETKYGNYNYYNCHELQTILAIYANSCGFGTFMLFSKLEKEQILHPVQCCRILYLCLVKGKKLEDILKIEYEKRQEVERSIKYYPDRFSFYFHSTSSEFLNSFFTLSILKREFVEEMEYSACITEDERGNFIISFRIKDFASSLMNNYTDIKIHEEYYDKIRDYRAYQAFFESAGKTIPDAMATYLHELSHMIFDDVKSYLEDQKVSEDLLKLPHWVYNFVQDFRINANIYKSSSNTKYIDFGDGLCVGTKMDFVKGSEDPDIKMYGNLLSEVFESITEKDSQICSIRKIKDFSQKWNLSFEDKKVVIKNCPIYNDDNEIIDYKFIKIKDNHPDGNGMQKRSKERQKRIKAILTHVEKQTARGNKGLPVYMESLITNYVRGLVDPRDVLKNFVANSTSFELESTIKRKNKKYSKFLPSTVKKYESRINVYIDESGSVSDVVLENFLGIMKDLAEFSSLKIIPFDCEINEESIFTVERGKDIPYGRTCGGGTQFDSALEHYQNEFLEGLCDGAIILTDGGSGREIYPGLPLVWVLPETDKLYCDLGPQEELLKFPFSLSGSLTL